MEKQKQRTEEEWRRLHENAICAVIAGKTANFHLSEWGDNSIVSDAISLADTLVKRLKEEEKEATAGQ
ncbi:MAG: hypothetical protein IKZ52_01570 [Bacteroidales bacterium]|jgi:hypothetical protein|nr:hypothetical protein [Bacteroidales bacterium]